MTKPWPASAPSAGTSSVAGARWRPMMCRLGAGCEPVPRRDNALLDCGHATGDWQERRRKMFRNPFIMRVPPPSQAPRIHGRNAAKSELAITRRFMNLQQQNLTLNGRRKNRRAAGFSLVEVTVGMAVIGTSAIALFSGFTSGFFTMQMARENLRATQIMLEKTETLRLYSWDQINTGGFIPATFTAPYDPNSTNGGIVY